MTPDSESGSGRAAEVRPPAAEAEAIWKSFGRTTALQDVSVSVQPGECHALVGRNGAGKSTLVGVLTGLLRPDRGSVRLYGEPAPSLGDRAAWQERVACVYQRSMVIPSLSVGENIFLNRNEGSLVHWRELRRQSRQLLFEWGFDLDVDQPVSELSVEQKQVVEIARALAIGARFLILDEPTASLESHAIQRLFERVRRVKASGVGILYISHHLEEVYEICDRATVFRDGRQVVSAPVAELDHEQLVAAMVGGALARASRGKAPPPGPVDAPLRLSVRGLSAQTPLGSLEDVSLEVYAGECVGLFGLRGSGTTVIADAVAGLVKPSAGEIELDGKLLPPGKVDTALRRGVGYVPEDRHARGFVPTLGVSENHTPTILERVSRWGHISRARRRAAADRIAGRLQIVASSGGQPVSELSGGNQQKVVVGRALAAEPSLLVVVSPTVGVDVASKEALLAVVDHARQDGTAVLLVSDDLEELRICTRVLVIRRGTIVRELREAPWDRHELIAAAEGLEVAV
ncbi:MAG: simple sugar transport system ATP-binding protein [Gaiellales bacterium]|nr:simple sugar transport system ATP-binding protein [Gaiellales bacterium]